MDIFSPYQWPSQGTCLVRKRRITMKTTDTLAEAIEDVRIIESLRNHINYNPEYRTEDKKRVSRILEETIEHLQYEVTDLEYDNDSLIVEDEKYKADFDLIIAVIQEDIEKVKKYIDENKVNINAYFRPNIKHGGYHVKSINDQYKSLDLPQRIVGYKTYIMYAAVTDNIEIFQLLYENGAILEIEGVEGRRISAISTAIESSSTKVIEYLHEKGHSIQISQEVMKSHLKAPKI